MRKYSLIDFERINMSPKDFGEMMVNIYNTVEKGDSRPAKDFFDEFRKL